MVKITFVLFIASIACGLHSTQSRGITSDNYQEDVQTTDVAAEATTIAIVTTTSGELLESGSKGLDNKIVNAKPMDWTRHWRYNHLSDWKFETMPRF